MPPPDPTTPRTLTVAATSLRASAATDDTPATFEGQAVPWDVEIDIWGLRESFAPGSCEPAEAGAAVYYRHREPVGLLTSHSDTDTGWQIGGRLSGTTLGRDASILLRDGVITRLSVGFTPVEWEEILDPDGTQHVRYTRATIHEVSLVPNPAYEDTPISNVRHTPAKENPVPDNETADVLQLREDVDDLTRRVDLIPTDRQATPEACPLLQWRSVGHYVTAVAAGDEAAIRAYAGIVAGDVLLADDEATWVGDIIRIVKAKQRVANAFQHTRDLPPHGLWLEYGYLSSDTTQVAEQVAEGDPLVYGKVSLGDDKTRIRTIGGWTDFSRQAIERSSRNVVDLAYQAMAQKYGRTIEAIARQVLTDTYNARVALGGDAVVNAGVALNALTADAVLDLLVALVERLDESDRNIDGIYCSRDVFLALAHVDEDKKMLQLSAAPTDKLGTLTLSSLELGLSNLKVALLPNWGAGRMVAFDSLAIRTQESPGAPFRLQDENIVNLTKAFSMYGYVSSYCQLPDGIVPITFVA